MLDKEPITIDPAGEAKVLSGRKAVDAYRETHTALHAGGWYKGISEDHIPLLENLKLNLKEIGFDSLGEFEAQASKYQVGTFVDDYISNQSDRIFNFISDTSEPAFMQATYEAIINNMKDDSDNAIISWHPKTLYIGIPRHSKIEVINQTTLKELGMKCTRGTFPSGDVGFISAQTPIISIIDKSTYCIEAGFEICKRIQQSIFVSLGITTDWNGNDLVVNGKKLGATTCFRIGDINVLAVGALLDLDMSLVDSIVSMKKSRSGREGAIPSERLITAKSILGRDVEYEEYEEAFLETVHNILHINVTRLETDVAGINKLLPKYESEQWTLTGEYNVD